MADCSGIKICYADRVFLSGRKLKINPINLQGITAHNVCGPDPVFKPGCKVVVTEELIVYDPCGIGCRRCKKKKDDCDCGCDVKNRSKRFHRRI